MNKNECLCHKLISAIGKDRKAPVSEPIRKTWLCSASLLHEGTPHQGLSFTWENHYLVTERSKECSADDCAAQ